MLTAVSLAALLLVLACSAASPDVPQAAQAASEGALPAPVGTVLAPKTIHIVPVQQKVIPVQSAGQPSQEPLPPSASALPPSDPSSSFLQGPLPLVMAGALVLFALFLVLMGRRKASIETETTAKEVQADE